MENLQQLMNQYTIEWIDISILSINLLLIVLAKKLLALIYHGSTSDSSFLYKVRILRALNLFILIFYSFELFLADQTEGLIARIIYIAAVCYLGYLTQYIVQYFVHRRYGKKRDIEGSTIHIETYSTRLLSIFSAVFIFIIVLISSIHILQLDSLLEAGGVIGFIGVFLALTQSVWAPDIFSGLIILNSNMMEEGDVVELDGTIATVYKTRVFHTELLNLINNHRVMIKNARLREATIHNLSKFASAKGLREKLVFKISYQLDEGRIREMFEQSFRLAEESGDIKIEFQYPLEIGVQETGDYAVEWAVYYYIKDIRALIKTRMAFREIILKQSKQAGISLATPNLHEVENKNPGK